MHTTIGLTAYRRGVIDSLRGWTTALEIAYRSGDVASVRTAQDAIDRLSRLAGLAVQPTDERAAS
ncbi:hypothetical protein [Agrococcus jejuensis]|uniref:Uncharacterized protein n=1 Tax=Agrococcus jejuensis TaxID=399736 RepID=A0A1G8DNH2_9MICO|nr:hypothetical protein [Agrococcus jejuensis]SDH59207.1 hypothetical protein SAMN04489720_1712 [Agrococcus jejuensis]